MRIVRTIGKVNDYSAVGEPMGKKLLWVGEVARELGVCSRTVSRLADAGAVEVIRDAKGRRHFKPEAVHVLRRRLGLEEASECERADYTPDAI
jgi:hypothetical protein